jgi:SPX domain protein involved in polyphosphate accumulation
MAELQQQRLELKYIIPERTALGVRDFVRSYLELDEFGHSRPNYSYPVHSLYLDSDEMRLYWDTINGTKNRYKLRLRFYENRPKAPVYFEIKRRMNSCILKQRGGVRREAVDWLLSGHLPEPTHLTSQDPRQLVALQRFCQRMMHIHARPKAHIAYLREAWVSPHDNSIRITMDREVKCERDFTTQLNTDMVHPVQAFGAAVILEIKFTVRGQRPTLWETEDDVILDMKTTPRYPYWFQELVRSFDLIQCGAAKYVEGVDAVGEQLFRGSVSVEEYAHAARAEVERESVQRTEGFED